MVRKVHVTRADVAERQRALINAIRYELVELPVSVAEGTFQCNEISLSALRDARDYWGISSSTMTADGRQQWPDVGNSVHLFTESQFADFVARIGVARAARNDRLYSTARLYKAQLPLPPEHEVFHVGSKLWQEQL